MSISEIGGVASTQNVYSATASKKVSQTEEATEKVAEKVAEKKPNVDKVEISKDEVTMPKKLTTDQVNGIKTAALESYNNMVRQMFVSQSSENNTSSNIMTQLKSVLNSSFGAGSIGSMNGAGATNGAGSIENDPNWGVDAVATRIMDMAIALSGGDSTKADMLRGAVEKGFKAAGVDLGGRLPDVSNKTYQEVMKRFDHWKENGSLEKYQYGASSVS